MFIHEDLFYRRDQGLNAHENELCSYPRQYHFRKELRILTELLPDQTSTISEVYFGTFTKAQLELTLRVSYSRLLEQFL